MIQICLKNLNWKKIFTNEGFDPVAVSCKMFCFKLRKLTVNLANNKEKTQLKIYINRAGFICFYAA